VTWDARHHTAEAMGFVMNWLAEFGSARPPRMMPSVDDRQNHSARAGEAEFYYRRLPALGHKQLEKVTPADEQALLNANRAERLAPRTIQYIPRDLARCAGCGPPLGARIPQRCDSR
jgi:hypothetical protein